MAAVRHYYHVWAAGAWECPVEEHLTALAAAGLRAGMVIGLAGPAGDRRTARKTITRRLSELGLPAPLRWAEADEGWEQVTLGQVHLDVHQVPSEYPVLYAHTKGAHNNSETNAAWRRSMTRRLVSGWRQCAKLLDDGYDTVGCHWITPEDECPYPDQTVDSPFYGGNFWWASSSYLATLPEPWKAARHDAEAWVGLGAPCAYDLLPGWPSTELFRQQVDGLMDRNDELLRRLADD